jgi:hypothetical protein
MGLQFSIKLSKPFSDNWLTAGQAGLLVTSAGPMCLGRPSLQASDYTAGSQCIYFLSGKTASSALLGERPAIDESYSPAVGRPAFVLH